MGNLLVLVAFCLYAYLVYRVVRGRASRRGKFVVMAAMVLLPLGIFSMWPKKPVNPFAMLMAQHQQLEVEDINKPTLVRRKLNGIPIAIPSNYLFLPMEHVGQNIWAPPPEPKPQYDENSELKAFSIRVRLPDLEPRTPQNYQDYLEAFHQMDDKWIVVGIVPFDLSTVTPKVTPENYLTINLERTLKMSQHYGKGQYLSWVHSTDKRFGLSVEVLDGADYTKFDYENKQILHAEKDGRTYTFITCGVGPTAKPGGQHTCHQKFVLEDISATVEFSYPPKHLENWVIMQDKVAQLFRSFLTDRSKSTLTVKH